MAGGRAPICGAPTDLGGGGALLRPQPSRSRSHTADGISTDADGSTAVAEIVTPSQLAFG